MAKFMLYAFNSALCFMLYALCVYAFMLMRLCFMWGLVYHGQRAFRSSARMADLSRIDPGALPLLTVYAVNTRLGEHTSPQPPTTGHQGICMRLCRGVFAAILTRGKNEASFLALRPRTPAIAAVFN